MEPVPEISEYTDSYCCPHRMPLDPPDAVIPQCTKSYEKQPIGGHNQARARTVQEEMAGFATTTRHHDLPGMATMGLPVYDQDFVANVYNQADRGTHRVHPQWEDPRWSTMAHATTTTLYQPSDRDPPHRNTYCVYRTTLVDPLYPPVQPLSVPDVHKMRYMQNNYMTADDWY
ncbi:hypothetical protein NP493_258g01025 [Ridgeia piscesae]|uniref:Uncharacterized protein n=1 Tax=Ridgeia piscesae TaxID=27915 RepID=A0AAD9NY46_RIDPI|nr:hypothetical protein NP493_258g01025 [Ridgeia piscesae]